MQYYFVYMFEEIKVGYIAKNVIHLKSTSYVVKYYVDRTCVFRVVYFKNQHMASNSLSKKYEIHIKHKTQ